MELVVCPKGIVRCLYGEEIDITLLGQVEIHRGAHVEPLAGNQWCADLSPVGGPILVGLATRSQALAAEEAWLRANWLVS